MIISDFCQKILLKVLKNIFTIFTTFLYYTEIFCMRNIENLQKVHLTLVFNGNCFRGVCRSWA